MTIDGNTGQIVGAALSLTSTNFIDVGGNGNGINLARLDRHDSTNAGLDDHVISEGTITGNGGAEGRWRAETTINDGDTVVFNRLFLESDVALGDLRFVNYLDRM